MKFIRRRRLPPFGHIARLTQVAPAHCQVGLASVSSLGWYWRRPPGQTNSATTLDLSLPTSRDRLYCGWSDAMARAGYVMTTTTTLNRYTVIRSTLTTKDFVADDTNSWWSPRIRIVRMYIVGGRKARCRRGEDRGTEDSSTMELRWCGDDLFVRDAGVDDVDGTWITWLTGNHRCPPASVPDVAVYRDGVKHVHRVILWTQICLALRLCSCNHYSSHTIEIVTIILVITKHYLFTKIPRSLHPHQALLLIH